MGGIVVCGMSQEEGSRRVAEAYDRGVNYFDCAPSYFNGEAEMKLGEALRPYRSKVFLAEKTMSRDAKSARAELERSLQRFHTDHVDLYQFHAVSSMEDVDKILAPGGAAETFFAAKKEGKARHLGFSAHNAPAALRLMDALELDSVLFPVNVKRLGKRWLRPADPRQSQVERHGAHGFENARLWKVAQRNERKRSQVPEVLV